MWQPIDATFGQPIGATFGHVRAASGCQGQIKTGPQIPPGVQTHQFSALGAAVATRRAAEGQEAREPRSSRFELQNSI